MPRPAQWSSICENVSRFSLGRLKQSVPSRTPALGQGVVTMGGRATFAGGRGGIVLRGGGGSKGGGGGIQSGRTARGGGASIFGGGGTCAHATVAA